MTVLRSPLASPIRSPIYSPTVGKGGGDWLVNGLPAGYDLYVSPTYGHDSNAGSSRAAPLASLRGLRNRVDAINPNGVTLLAYVEGGHTWSEYYDPVSVTNRNWDVLNLAYSPALPTVVDIQFGPNTVIDGRRYDRLTGAATDLPTDQRTFKGSASGLQTDGANANFTFIARGADETDKLEIKNFGVDDVTHVAKWQAAYPTITDWGSGQGVGGSGSGKLILHDAIIRECGDIISFHQTSSAEMHRVEGYNGHKTNVVNVNTATVQHFDCVYEQDAGAQVTGAPAAVTYGQMLNNSTGDTFTRCALRKGANSTTTPLNFTVAAGETFIDCEIGAPGKQLTISPKANGATFTDCYINASYTVSNRLTFTGCWGQMQYRATNIGTIGPIRRKCVFIGPSGSGALYLNYSPGTPYVSHTDEDNVFMGYATALGHGFDATKSANLIAVNPTMRNNALYSNGVDIDPTLAAANAGAADPKPIRDNITGVDPQIAGLTANGGSYATLAALVAGSKARADFRALNPALAAAGYAGGQVGFAA